MPFRSHYLEMFNRTKAKWMLRDISANAQNPLPFSAEQWWKPPPTLMAHPRSFASFEARTDPPTYITCLYKKIQLKNEVKNGKSLQYTVVMPVFEMDQELFSVWYNWATLQLVEPANKLRVKKTAKAYIATWYWYTFREVKAI